MVEEGWWRKIRRIKMIKIRAHHLLCIPRFYSGGYNKKFAKNMKKIVYDIRKNPHQKIKIVIGKPDDLCMACPHLKGEACKNPEEVEKWVILEDKKVAKHIKIKPNSIHLAKELFNLSMQKVRDKDVKKICKECPFMENCLHVGINKSFQKDINKKSK